LNLSKAFLYCGSQPANNTNAAAKKVAANLGAKGHQIYLFSFRLIGDAGCLMSRMRCICLKHTFK